MRAGCGFWQLNLDDRYRIGTEKVCEKAKMSSYTIKKLGTFASSKLKLTERRCALFLFSETTVLFASTKAVQ